MSLQCKCGHAGDAHRMSDCWAPGCECFCFVADWEVSDPVLSPVSEPAPLAATRSVESLCEQFGDWAEAIAGILNTRPSREKAELWYEFRRTVERLTFIASA